MSFDLFKLKLEHGHFFVLNFKLGVEIPFKTISLEQFFSIQQIIALNRIPLSILETRIFKECVLEPYWLKDEVINKLEAGIVSTVAQTILTLSGPQDPEITNLMLNENRQAYNVSTPIGRIYVAICSVFPYTLDKLDKMKWQEILSLYSLAESFLIEKGTIEEPLRWLTQEEMDELNMKAQQRQSKKQPSQLEQDIHHMSQEGLITNDPWDVVERNFREGIEPKIPISAVKDTIYELQKKRQTNK